MSGSTAVADRQSLRATPRRQPPRRVGFGTWALAVQLRLKPLGRRTADLIRPQHLSPACWSTAFSVRYNPSLANHQTAADRRTDRSYGPKGRLASTCVRGSLVSPSRGTGSATFVPE